MIVKLVKPIVQRVSFLVMRILECWAWHYGKGKELGVIECGGFVRPP